MRINLSVGIASYAGFVASILIALPYLTQLAGFDVRFFPQLLMLPVFVASFLLVMRRPALLRIPHAAWALLFLWALSLGWVEPIERGRGALIVGTVMLALPWPALVSRERDLAAFFWGVVAGSLLSMAAVYHHYLFAAISPILGDGPPFNKNAVACYFSFCIVSVIFLRERSERRANALLLPIAAFYGLTVVLTASRGAVLALALIGAILATKELQRNGSRVLFAVPVVLAGLMFVDVSNLEVSWRFASDTTGTLGGRTGIWSEAWGLGRSNPWLLLHGVGVGGVEEALGGVIEDGSVLGEDFINRKAAHNSLVELYLYAGIPGFLLGMYVFALFVRSALRRAKEAPGMSVFWVLVAYCMVFGTVTCLWRTAHWPGLYVLLCTAFIPLSKAQRSKQPQHARQTPQSRPQAAPVPLRSGL